MRYENPYQTWRSTLFLMFMWVVMLAVILQNARTVASYPVDAPFTPREVLVYVSHDNTVYTMDSGIQQAHVPLITCPHRQLSVQADDNTPAFALSDVTWLEDEQLAFRFVAHVPYYIVSSYLDVAIHFTDGGENPAIRIVLDCPPRAQQQHLLLFVWHEDMLYLHDVMAGNMQPVLPAPQACRVAWQVDENTQESIATWDMSVPLETGSHMFPPDSLIAFSMTVAGDLTIEMPAYDGLILHYEDEALRLWSDCP